MELSILSVSWIAMVFILLLFTYQFSDNIFVTKIPDKIDIDLFNELDEITSCRALYPRTTENCEDCGNSTYRKLTVGDKPVIIDGTTLTKGEYCVRNNLPPCKYGFLIVDGLDKFACICTDPNHFNGPACATPVACNTEFGIRGKFVNGQCDCPRETPQGLRVTRFGTTECIVDPCTSHLPNPSNDIIGFQNGRCNCGNVLENEIVNDTTTICSSCNFSVDGARHTIPLRCFNSNYTLDAMFSMYPCREIDSPITCGTTTVSIKSASDAAEGFDGGISDLTRVIF